MPNNVTSSGKKIASAQIFTGPGALTGFDLTPPQDCNVIVTFYDSEDASTTGKLELLELELDAGLSSLNHDMSSHIAVNRGLYVVYTPTGTQGTSSYIVRFTRG